MTTTSKLASLSPLRWEAATHNYIIGQRRLNVPSLRLEARGRPVTLDPYGRQALTTRPPMLFPAPVNTDPSTQEALAALQAAFGMWADREDIGDTVEYVNRLRQWRDPWADSEDE